MDILWEVLCYFVVVNVDQRGAQLKSVKRANVVIWRQNLKTLNFILYLAVATRHDMTANNLNRNTSVLK